MKDQALLFKTTAPTQVTDGDKRCVASLPAFNLLKETILEPLNESQLTHCVLCLTVARDSREENTLTIGIGPEYLKAVDVGFVSAGQRIRVPLKPEATVLLNKYDLHLHSTDPLWIVAENDAYPHLQVQVSSSQMTNDYLSRLCDSAVTQFGWMFGCVLDALHDLHRATGEARYLEGLHKHLDNFIDDESVNYESPRSEIAVNNFESIELTLPFAVIAQLYPQHPAIDVAIDFLRSRRRDDGLIYDGASITAEGCYTIAYPLMVIGQQRNDQDLIDWSWQQLALRRKALWQDGHLYLRNYNGEKSFEDWARGIAWYILGHVRTCIASASEPSDEMRSHLQELAAWLKEKQNIQGLWYNFLGDADNPIDSSGSAGIAAALALAASRDWIDAIYMSLAQKTLAGLEQHVVDGGFLDSVARNNKRGEAEQRLPQRSCEPFALGLMGQLTAALL